MISLSLSKNDFAPLGIEYNVVKVDQSNFENNRQYVLDSINNFNIELKWDEMFTFEEASSRIYNNMKVYIGLIDSKVFGHLWFRDYKDGSYAFNLFVKNRAKTENFIATEFASDVLNRFENKYPVYCDVDEWNKKSLKLVSRLGFKSR
jgi:RimJ/RimL family protein N-acetyltransferase